MTKINTITINIAKSLAPIISSRDVAASLKKLISKSRSIIVDLDFQDVEFVSRSAAHELLLLKDKFTKALLRRKTVNFINTRDDVANMIRVVAASRAVPKSKKEELHIEKVSFDSLSQLAF